MSNLAIRPSIVFMANHPWERPAKIARALRLRGYSVILIYVLQPNNFDPADYFDHVFQAKDAFEAVAVVQRMSPKLIHLFSYGADGLAALLFRNKVGKIIYDAKDWFEGVNGATTPANFAEAQREWVEGADGIVCRDLQMWNYCRVNKLKANGPRLLFYDYCWGLDKPDIHVRNDGEVHTVIAGNFSVEKTFPEHADSGYLHVARALVKNKVHIHIYPRWHFRYIKDWGEFSEYFELAEQSPYCHIHEPASMANFTKELSQYDFGLGIFQGALFTELPLNSCVNGHEGHGIATRWFDYLEAGLDIFATPALKNGYRVMRAVDAVLPATPGMFMDGSVKDVLLKRMHTYKKLRLEAARERYDIRNNIGRLIDYYNHLLA